MVDSGVIVIVVDCSNVSIAAAAAGYRNLDYSTGYSDSCSDGTAVLVCSSSFRTRSSVEHSTPRIGRSNEVGII